jgi:hypothetical protein
MTTQAAQQASTSAVDVVVSWGKSAIAVERLGVDETFTIGAAAAADKHFVCEHASIPSDRFALVENGRNGIRVRAAEGMKLYVDGKRLELSDATLARTSRALVRVGPLEIRIAEDRRAPTVLDRIRDVVDARLLRLSGIALTAHAGVVIMMLLANSPASGLDALRDFPPRWVTTAMKPPPPPTRVVRKETTQEIAQSSSAPGKRSPRPSKPRSTKDLVAEAMKSLHLGDGGAATSNVFGAGVDVALDQLRPGHALAAGGGGGLGLKDTGGGGGGNGYGIGALDGYGTRSCEDCGDLVANAGHRKKTVVVVEKPPVFSDGLSREEIQRVVSRAMARIKYCYEKELNRDPSLDGKLAMSWVIAGDGSVASSNVAQNTFSAPGGKQAASCVNHVIEGLKFPSPRGGGTVVVTYPFVFSSSGG